MGIIFSCADDAGAGGNTAAALPEPLDLSQDRAFALLRLLGLPEQSEGALEASGIPQVRQRLLVAVNSKSARSSELVPAVRTGREGGPRFMYPAFTDEYLARQASRFMDFFDRAHAAQRTVVWS
jgi:hypothetical protein